MQPSNEVRLRRTAGTLLGTGQFVAHVVVLALTFSVTQPWVWFLLVDGICLVIHTLDHSRSKLHRLNGLFGCALFIVSLCDVLAAPVLLLCYCVATLAHNYQSTLAALWMAIGFVNLTPLMTLLLVVLKRCNASSPLPSLRRQVSALQQHILGADLDSQCGICLDPLVSGDTVRDLANCNHKFHTVCIDPWIRENNSCPNCRRPAVAVVPPEVVPPQQDSV